MVRGHINANQTRKINGEAKHQRDTFVAMRSVVRAGYDELKKSISAAIERSTSAGSLQRDGSLAKSESSPRFSGHQKPFSAEGDRGVVSVPSPFARSTSTGTNKSMEIVAPLDESVEKVRKDSLSTSTGSTRPLDHPNAHGTAASTSMESHDPLDVTNQYHDGVEKLLTKVSAPHSPLSPPGGGARQRSDDDSSRNNDNSGNYGSAGAASEEDRLLLKAVSYQAFAARELLMRGSIQLQESAVRAKLLQQL